MNIFKTLAGLFLTVLALEGIFLLKSPDSNLHIIACDVGQGDAILVTYKNTQLLTDGGPGKKVVDCLSNHMPFYDREIELVISTHPDADHAAGLVEVLDRYKVDQILINSINPGTQVYKALENSMGGGGVIITRPTPGMKLGMGMIYLELFNPDAEILAKDFAAGDPTNDYSIVFRLTYKKFAGLFTGDISPEVSDKLADIFAANNLTTNYLKVPHHGSKNGLTEELLKTLKPTTAVVSAGRKNRYGHPHAEIIDMLKKYNVRVLGTYDIGDVEVVTDGEKLWVR